MNKHWGKMNLSELPPLHGQTVTSNYNTERGSFDITTFGVLSGREIGDEIEERCFKETDAEEAVKCLRRCFQVMLLKLKMGDLDMHTLILLLA